MMRNVFVTIVLCYLITVCYGFFGAGYFEDIFDNQYTRSLFGDGLRKRFFHGSMLNDRRCYPPTKGPRTPAECIKLHNNKTWANRICTTCEKPCNWEYLGFRCRPNRCICGCKCVGDFRVFQNRCIHKRDCPPFTTKKPVTCKTKPPTKPPTKPTKPTIKPPTIPPCEYNKIYYPYCGYVEEFCRNPPRDFEIHVCPPPGCYCPKNFALDDYGVCIPRSLCPTTPCPPTECPTTCPTTCPTEVPTCEPETTTTPCPFQCEPNCIYLEYGICEATCDNLKPEVTAVRLPAGCYCPPAGFARDCDNNCIPVSDCP